jgi:hypothetical protein
MEAADPNLDPRWDWRAEESFRLFLSPQGGTPTPVVAQTPFRTAWNILNRFTADFEPEDGWMLVHKDFGTPAAGVPFPYFTLYNRYRGLFRVMLFNGANREESFYIGQLSFLEGNSRPDRTAAILTFAADQQDAFRSHYDRTQSLVATCQMATYGDWAVFDFPLAGFDPELEKRDPVLILTLKGIAASKLQMEGQGRLDLVEKQVAETTPGFAFSGGDLAGAAQTGYKFFKDVDTWFREEASNPKNKDQFWFGPVQKLLTSSRVASFVPIIASLGGFVNAFVGGANRAGPREPLAFTGQLQFGIEGGLETTRQLWATAFYLVPGPRDGLAQRPLQKVPWGIFNIENLPLLQVKHIGDPGPEHRWMPLHVRLARPTILLNQETGMDFLSCRISYQRNNVKQNDRDEEPMPFLNLEQAIWPGCDFGPDHSVGNRILWEFKFRIREAVKHSDHEIVLYKSTVYSTVPDG